MEQAVVMSNWVPGSPCSSGTTVYVPASYSETQSSSVIFFNDHNCTDGGSSYSFPPGTEIPDLHRWGEQTRGGGWNDLISSAVVPPNVVVQVWADGNYSGATKVLGPGVYPSMGLLRYDAPNANSSLDDNISSFKVSLIEEHREFLRKCCFGQVTGVCANYSNPYGAECQRLLGVADCNNREAFFGGFGGNCKRWTQGLEGPMKNELGRRFCPSASTPAEREYCACFLTRDFPPEWENSPNVAVLKANWPCMDAVCNDATRALQPHNKNCPSALTICSQQEVRTALEGGASVGNQTVQNACGNVFVGGQTQVPATLPPTLPPSRLPVATPPQSPSPGPTAPAGGFLSRYTTTQKVLGASAILTLLLLIVGGILYARRATAQE